MSVTRLDTYITEQERQLLDIMKGVQDKYTRKVLQIFRQLQTTRQLTESEKLELIAIIRRELSTLFSTGEYPAAIQNYIQNFDNVQRLTIATITPPPGAGALLISAERKLFVDQIVNTLLTRPAIDAVFINPVQRIIYNAVEFGSPFGQVEDQIRNLVIGTPDKSGLLERYTGQITRDSLNQFSGAIYNQSVIQYGFEVFRYVNSLVDDSREFCVSMVNGSGKFARFVNNGVFLIKDIQEICNIAEGMPGWIPGTNRDNFFINRGGNNCRHKAIPGLKPKP